MPDLSQTLRTAFTRVLNRRSAVRRGRLDVVPDFESKILGNRRQLTIYAPPGYSDRDDRRYPVLYMQDGQNLFDDSRAFGGHSWRLHDHADHAIGARTAAPMIIVGIDHTHADRIHEFTPTRDESRKAGGKASTYGRMLLEEIKPIIDATYRTRDDDTSIGGSSLGGLVSLYLALRVIPSERSESRDPLADAMGVPRLPLASLRVAWDDIPFRAAAVMSPSVWWNGRAILGEVDRFSAPQRPRIWLDVGGREGREALNDVRLLRDRLKAKGWSDATLHYFEDRRADHSERAWGARARKVLEFLFPAE
jgi:predicted alpha/beta superfamily hydrolase